VNEYPRELLHADGPKLADLGLSRDSQGRIRTKDGAYVCAVSGRVHSKRLYRIPDYQEGDGWHSLWVDEQEARAAGLDVLAGGPNWVGILGQLGKVLLP
jgi:hypothetical protein